MTHSKVSVGLRPAERDDIPALLVLENISFVTDRLGAAQFRRFISGTTARVIVAMATSHDGHPGEGLLAGYVLVLFRAGSRRARIYSIAVAKDYRGLGIGEQLLDEAEAVARSRGCVAMKLEVRPDNVPALGLYGRRGYVAFGRYTSFYEDGTDAVRLEKAF